MPGSVASGTHGINQQISCWHSFNFYGIADIELPDDDNYRKM